MKVWNTLLIEGEVLKQLGDKCSNKNLTWFFYTTHFLRRDESDLCLAGWFIFLPTHQDLTLRSSLQAPCLPSPPMGFVRVSLLANPCIKLFTRYLKKTQAQFTLLWVSHSTFWTYLPIMSLLTWSSPEIFPLTRGILF